MIIIGKVECYVENIPRSEKDLCLGALILYIISLPLIFIDETFELTLPLGTFFWFAVLVVMYFLIGTIGGLIIEKLKSRKK